MITKQALSILVSPLTTTTLSILIGNQSIDITTQPTQEMNLLASSSLSVPLPAPPILHNHHHSDDVHHSNQSSPPLSSNSSPKTLQTLRSRLGQLCQEGQPHLARQLFDTIPRPTTLLWNTIIIGFICNNLPNEALLFYGRMKSSPDTKFDSYTYSSTLKACADAGCLHIGRAVHCHLIRCQSNPSRIVYNSLLNMYSTCLSTMDNEMGFSEFDFSKYDTVRKVFNTMGKRNVVSWNTMVLWYVKTKRYVDAIKLFKTMMKLGIKPTAVSFVNVFPAMSQLGDLRNANVLYGQLLKLGNDYVTDVYIVSSAIFMYTELGCVDIARKIFERCLDRNTEVWNTMIGGFVQNNRPVEGIDLFLQALDSDDIVLDEVTFLHAMNAVSQMQQLDFGKQLHSCILKYLSGLRVTVLNAIIVMYSRCNFVETSFEVFENMSERDLVSWNTMVSAFVQNGLDDEGLMLVYEMQKQGFRIDSVTVAALLSAASNLRNQDIGKQTHAYLLRHQIQFEGMDSYLIDMYAKSGLINIVQRLFEKISSCDIDQVTWNAIIAGYTQNGLFEDGLDVFKQMLDQHVMPNAITIASILPACSPMGTISLGKQLHAFSIRQLMDENVFVSTALVDMYSKSGAITHAETIFANIPNKNSVTYTNMILAYGQHGMGEKALALFHSMKGSGIKPDAITFVAVLSACSYAGLVDEGLQIFEAMEREHRIEPSAEHYCCVVDMLGKVGRVMEAYQFVKELGEEGNMLGIWGSLLGACKIHGEFELGKVVAEELLGMETLSNMAGYHVLLSNIYAAEGKWENVDRVRKGMRDKGLRKEVGCSWIDIAGHENSFVSKDQKHTQSNKIYDMLEVLTMEMKHAGYRPTLISHIGGIPDSSE